MFHNATFGSNIAQLSETRSYFLFVLNTEQMWRERERE